MRYWVYQDSRIQGPFTREDLPSVTGLGPESLVCPETAEGAGKIDSDWLPLQSVPELASLVAGSVPVAAGDAPDPEDSFDAFREKAHAALEEMGFSGDWISGALDDSRLSPYWEWLDQGPGMDARLEAERARTKDLEDRLLQLKEELERFEKRQDEILERLDGKDRLLSEKTRELEQALAKISELESRPEPAVPAAQAPVEAAPAPQPVSLAPIGEADAVEIQEPASVLPPAPAEPSRPNPPVIIEEELPAPAAPPEPPEIKPLTVAEILAQAQAAARKPDAAVEASLMAAIPDPTPLKSVSSLPEAVDFVAPEPEAAPPIEAAQAPAEAGEASPAAVSGAPPVLPEAAAPEAPSPLPEAPMPSSETAPSPLPEAVAQPSISLAAPDVPPEPLSLESFEQPRTMVFGEGQPQEAVPPVSEPSPLPAPPVMDPFPGPASAEGAPGDGGLQSLSFTPIPLSEPPMMGTPEQIQGPKTSPPIGQPDLPATVIQGLGLRTPVPGAATPAPLSALSEAGTTIQRGPVSVMPTGAADVASSKPRKKPKGFLVAMGAALGCLVAIAVLFKRHPEQVVQMATMEPPRKGAAALAVGAPAAAPAAGRGKSVFPDRPQEGQEAPAIAAPPAAPAAPAAVRPAAPQSRDYIEDHGMEAKQFVKQYSLGGERGTIEQWLQYSFESAGNESNWDAGSLPDNIYIVTYSVYKSGQMRKGAELAQYLFQVDLNRRTLVGGNQEARDLLAGSPPRQQAPVRAPVRPSAPPAAAKPKPAKRAARRPVKPARGPEPVAQPAQLPLPEDSELAGPNPPSKGASFNNPGSDTLELNP